MTEFQIVSWDSFDDEELNLFTIHFFGRTLGGQSVHVSTYFKPYYFVKGRLPNNPIVKSKDLWGFQGGQECIFTKIECDTLADFRMSQRKYQGRLYEGNLDPMLRFMHRTGIKSTGWVRIPESAVPDSSSTCDLDFRVEDWKTIEALDRDDLMAPFRVCSLDIECYSSTGQFPSSLIPDDVCFQIAVTTKEFGREEFLDRKCFGVKTGYQTEREMLEAFVEHFTKLDPDIVTGWNVFGFDFEYIYNRLAICRCSNRVLGRLLSMESELINKKLSSSALGNNDLKILRMNGRYTFDMYQEIKREHKFESYSLNNVSKILLGDKKNDMPVHEIFSRFRTGQGLEEVEEYCIKDTELPHAISEKLSLIQNLFEMAKACWVPLSFLSERGQQIKVFSQMAQMARELGFMIPTLKREGSAEKYQGATVLEAQTGAYWCPITALDFASLYPSIMCAHNLCYSTYVFDKKFLNLPGVTYETFGPHTFATEVNGKPTPSLLPIILEKLKVYRKEAKKMMKQVPERYAVYNGKQLAYKISMNSVYGFTGASNGILPLVAIAETVTMRGRQMIEESKNYVEKHFPGSRVRYGDSVLGGTPVLTKSGPVQIENLGGDWHSYPGLMKEGTEKEQSELNIPVWTHEGWQIARRVIRHKCNKKIYRVLTHTGLVDVTEDHSLLDLSVNQIKPKDVQVGQELFHSFPEDLSVLGNCSVDQAYIYGMFVGDGSGGTYGSKYSWAINNSDRNLLEKCKTKLESIHGGKSFVILETLESSGVYKLVPNHGDIKSFAVGYRYQCYDGKSKKIPECVLVGQETCRAFLDGLWDSDGCRQDAKTGGCHRIDTKNQITAQWYFVLLKKLGYSVSLNCRGDKTDVFRLTWTTGKQRKNPNAIKKVSVLYENYDGYVYDIETDAGTFQAGIGQMIVKNTDSIMVEFDVEGRTGPEAIEYSWKLGERASKEISCLFKSPNKLELEKVYCPYFLYSKKRYAAKMWIQGDDGKMMFDHVDIKGLQVVRRDSCPFVRRICQEVLNTSLDSSDPSASIKIARKAKEDLLAGLIPMDDLVLTKSLSGDYKVQMPHVEVTKKMKERNPGSEPQVGSRVPFVIIKNNLTRLFEKAEDPGWVSQKNLKLDYQYYFEHQLEKPIRDLMQPIIGSDRDLFSKVKTQKITSFFIKKTSPDINNDI